MKLPRDISGTELARRLAPLGYEVGRTGGGHMQLVTMRNGEHHVTIPAHKVLKTGTLGGVLAAIAQHLGLSRIEISKSLFG